MDAPGGRATPGLATPGLEGAMALLADGAALAQVAREVVRVVAERARAREVLVITTGDRRSSDVVSFGVASDCLRHTTAAAAQECAPTRRSDPLLGVNAGAIPIVLRGRVVGAIGVAGPPDTLDPAPLPSAASLLAVAMDHGAGAAPTAALFRLAPLAHLENDTDLSDALLRVLAEFTSAPAFVCLPVAGRLQVSRYRGLERDRLAGVVAHPEFVDAVRAWQDRPTPPGDAQRLNVAGGAEVVVCAPLPGPEGPGLVALVVRPDFAAEAADILSAVGPHAGAARARAHQATVARRRDHEVDSIVQSAPWPMIVFDAEGRFVRINAAASLLFGLSGSFEGGRSARGRLANLDLEELLLDRAEPGEVEVQLGSPARTHRALVTRVYDGDRHLQSVLACEDLSTQRAQVQLQSDFVALIGHELRTPLTVAKGFVETVLARGDDLSREDRTEFLTTSLRQSERLEDLINDLLFVSTERPRTGLHHEQTDVLAVASRLCRRMSDRFPGREIDCLALGESGAVVDRRYLDQALRHLIDNALKYSEGPVTVEVGGSGGSVDVAVVDQGPGIFSGDIERLLEPFQQKDSSSTRAQGGTGLGLHVTRRLVEAMGSRLACDSRLGQGSRFSFQLPRRADSRENSPRASAVRDDATS